MGGIPVDKYEIGLAGNGGKVKLITRDGHSFVSPLFPLPFITAIAAVMAGPNPHYDHQNGVFFSGADFSRGFSLQGLHAMQDLEDIIDFGDDNSPEQDKKKNEKKSD